MLLVIHVESRQGDMSKEEAFEIVLVLDWRLQGGDSSKFKGQLAGLSKGRNGGSKRQSERFSNIIFHGQDQGA